jgi:hypothetical protein
MSNITKIIGGLLLVLVILSGIGYLYYRSRLGGAVSSLELSLDRVELRDLRLLPSPEANLTVIFVANNTREMGFTVSMMGELYYGDHFITPLTVEESYIRGDGLSTLRMDITLTGSIIEIIEPGNQNQYTAEGRLIARKWILGIIPITFTKPLSEFTSGQG